MKKIVFTILVIVAIALAFRIGTILINDIPRLTEYGYGYLTGLVILFIVLVGTSIWLGFKLFGRKHQP